jgi:hypothetical protein
LRDKNVSNRRAKKYTRKKADFLNRRQLLMLLHTLINTVIKAQRSTAGVINDANAFPNAHRTEGYVTKIIDRDDCIQLFGILICNKPRARALSHFSGIAQK